MTVTAYVLIQTEVGKAVSVAEQARKITGVLSATKERSPAQRRWTWFTWRTVARSRRSTAKATS